jgi:selenocysteine lyase/cysteine desulfurase
MSNRRRFLKNSVTLTAAMVIDHSLPASVLNKMEDIAKSLQLPNELTQSSENDFWSYIKESYTVSPNILNLNNGGVSPQPKIVQDAHERYLKLSNEAPSYYMWRILDMGREPLRERLANLAGADKEEISINRNSTEALNTIIFGLDLKPGDEVILAKQDYPNMINAWKQRELRDGIKLKWLNLELPNNNDQELVEQYINSFGERTRLVHLTHMINWTGQIMPVKKIIDAAHKKGIEVLLDAAHTFAHLPFSFKELNVDYAGTSLHKWLCAPFGTGMMFIKKEKIKNIFPLLCAEDPKSENIRKFENLGTRSFPAEMAIGNAIDFHEAIGIKRKNERLHFLKTYWTDKIKDIPGVVLNTPTKEGKSCAIANFKIEGLEPGEIDSELFSKYKLHTVAINWENIHGVRVTPHVYTSTQDLDKLVNAIDEISRKKKK